MNDTSYIARGPDLLDLKKMLNALAVEARLAMVAALAATDEVTVTDLGQLLADRGYFISQPLISWHVRALKIAGFVRTRRLGRQVYCSLDRARYDQCLRRLGELAAPRPGLSPVGEPAPETSTGMHGRSR